MTTDQWAAEMAQRMHPSNVADPAPLHTLTLADGTWVAVRRSGQVIEMVDGTRPNATREVEDGGIVVEILATRRSVWVRVEGGVVCWDVRESHPWATWTPVNLLAGSMVTVTA